LFIRTGFTARTKDLGPSSFVGVVAKLVLTTPAQLARSSVVIRGVETSAGILAVGFRAGRIGIGAEAMDPRLGHGDAQHERRPKQDPHRRLPFICCAGSCLTHIVVCSAKLDSQHKVLSKKVGEASARSEASMKALCLRVQFSPSFS